MSVAEMANLQQALLQGQKYLENRRTIVLGISPGNPHYYNTETLEKLFRFAENNSDKVLLFISDKISVHNYRAVCSKKPEKSARKSAKKLRNKCKDAMNRMGYDEGKFSFFKWVEEVEPSPAYIEAFQTITDLYQRNDEFRFDVQEKTKTVLTNKLRGYGIPDITVDVEEGVKYLLKQYAFFTVLPKIYTNCEEFVFVYHSRSPILEKYFGGFYDGIVKRSFGFFVFN